MPTAREQAGLLEASRLLQEGLQLLEERSREVDALLEDARERALDIRAEAEQRAQQVVADAEQRRTELEEQVAALQTEVAALREELVQLRTTRHGRGGRFVSTPPPPEPPPAVPLPAVEETPKAEPPTEGAGEETPQWGRRPSGGGAIRGRSRPRWFPPWLPLIALMALIGIVAAQIVGGAGSSSGAVVDPAATDALAPTSQPTARSATLAAAALAPLNQASTPTAQTVAPLATPTLALSATQPPARAPTALSTAPTAITVTRPPTPVASPTARPAATVPPALLPRYPTLPGESNRDGSIVAVYTSYFTYIVRPGDTVNLVATQFGVSGDVIVRASGLTDPNLLQPGQALTIPRESGWLYRVQPNETVETIAVRFGATADEVLTASMLSASAVVRPGELLFIPNHLILPKAD